MRTAAANAASYAEQWIEAQALYARAGIVIPPSAAAVRASVERGDSSLVVRDRPVGVGVDAGQRIRAANWPTLPAVTNKAVADDTDGANLPLGNLAGELDRDDADAMEHERQRRLALWQRQP